VRIAVVIPTLDEAGTIEAAIASAQQESDVEVLVADGGSRDATAAGARAAGARVIVGSRGRARQLEAGWRASEGDVVLFLHADTRLPAGWGGAVRSALADAAVAGGAFRLRFEPPLPVIEWGAGLRARWLGLPYGDQALFARRSALVAAGGIAPVPILEDLDLVRALRRHGRLALLPLAVTTSARRYRRRGVLRTWLRNAATLAAWRLGVDRERLAAWYAR
jgi:rSAM/selenodomain-associated transferase 2